MDWAASAACASAKKPGNARNDARETLMNGNCPERVPLPVRKLVLGMGIGIDLRSRYEHRTENRGSQRCGGSPAVSALHARKRRGEAGIVRTEMRTGNSKRR